MAKILLVDDDKMNGVLLQKRLIKRGFDCDYVEGGEECFKAIDQKGSNYSLVLLDIMMPNISGTEVLSKIRETKNNFELPVIMVTAKDEASDVVEALKGGANDYLTKPVNIDIAEARVETQLKIVDLMQESLKGKQMKTIATMVATLNHEINNPLAIAIGNLSIAQQKMDITRIDKAMSALNRITEIVKKIENISDGNIEETDYSGNISMYKI
jgi:DNA-binding response OmpR family regulator